MKRPALKYILIVSVVIIWGMIIYKIIFVIKGSDSAVTNTVLYDKNDSLKNQLDTFSIIANYPDPFLRRGINVGNSMQGNTQVVKKTVQPLTVKPVSVKKWPTISYGGVVSNYAGNKSTVLITINGSNYLMKKGDQIQEVELITITRDSVKLKFQEEPKYIKRYGAK